MNAIELIEQRQLLQLSLPFTQFYGILSLVFLLAQQRIKSNFLNLEFTLLFQHFIDFVYKPLLDSSKVSRYFAVLLKQVPFLKFKFSQFELKLLQGGVFVAK